MADFKKDKLILLQALRDIVMENFNAARPSAIRDIIESRDRRKTKRLQMVRRELDQWIDEVVAYRKNKKKYEQSVNNNK